MNPLFCKWLYADNAYYIAFHAIFSHRRVYLLVYRFFVGCPRQVFGGHLRVQLGSRGAHRRQFLQERTPERRDMDSRVLRPVVRTLSEVCARILESCQSFKGTLLHARLPFPLIM